MSDNALFSLTGQVAVVIGGGGVLAGARATGLAQAGAEIAILDVSQDGADARARAIEELGCAAIGVGCDATSKTSLEQALKDVLALLAHGDFLLNGAGVIPGTPFFEIPKAEWQRILDIALP